MLAEIHISMVLGFVFLMLYIVTIIGLVVLVLLENRNPLKTIPWVIVLLFVPGIGLVFYYFFGRDDRKLRIISRRTYSQMMENVTNEDSIKQELPEIPRAYVPLLKLISNSTYSAVFRGSEIKYYTNGRDKFDQLMADIRKAKHHIHLQYYIFEDDNIGRKMKHLLMEKACEGLKVRVLYDDMGSWHTKSKFFEEMKNAGVEVYPYLKSIIPLLSSKVNYRNHRKIVVIDGKIGYMGGMNIADRYVTGNELGQWRDTHFRFVGSAVHGLQAAFIADWCSMSSEIPKGNGYYPSVGSLGRVDVQIMTTGPSREWRTLLQAYIFCIANAKDYIYIQTPYFLPTEGLNQALQMAALAGIDVRLMIPKHSDTRTAQMATFSYIGKMLDAGVRVFLYDNGFLHSKLVVTDNEVASIGSSNFDFRSFEHNFEINAFVYQKEFAKLMREMFECDLQYCEEISAEEWKKRPLPIRLSESFMRLFSPLL